MPIADDQIPPMKTVLAIHGGLAGPRENLAPDRETSVRQSLEESLLAGYQALQSNAGSIQAVIAAVRVMEDSPHFNAGKGSVFSRSRHDSTRCRNHGGQRPPGRRSGSGHRIRNPIVAAHAVMTRAAAVFLVGDDADEFAAKCGLEMVDPEYFRTERRWNDFQAWKEAQRKRELKTQTRVQESISQGTVGAVALDRQGNLAAGTSTGGVSYKLPGRVGDSAVIGAGTFADNRSCAVSATGQGELFIRATAAYSVSARMMYRGQSLAASAQEAVDDIRSLGGEGGVIAIDRHGNLPCLIEQRGCIAVRLTSAAKFASRCTRINI